jgi:hypothetical protein
VKPFIEPGFGKRPLEDGQIELRPVEGDEQIHTARPLRESPIDFRPSTNVLARLPS